MGVTCSTRRTTMEKNTMVPYGKSEKLAHSSEAYVIEQLRAKEDYYSHDKNQDDRETINNSDIDDDQRLTEVDHKGVDQDHRKGVDQVDYNGSQVANVYHQAADDHHKVINNFDHQSNQTAPSSHQRVTNDCQTDAVNNQAVVVDQPLSSSNNQQTADHQANHQQTADHNITKRNMASLILTIEKVAPAPPHEIVLYWSNKSQLLDDLSYQLELNSCCCGDPLPVDVSSVTITLQPGMLHLLALKLLSPNAVVTSESVQLFIPKLSPIPQMSEISINTISSVAVVVNIELNIMELIPSSLINDSQETPVGVCLLSVYSLVLAFLCNEKFIGDVEITSDHINTTESGSCVVEIKCFVGGCLPKTKYRLQCGLSLKSKGLLDSSITLPSVTGRTSNVLEVTCPSPPEANPPVIVGCDYEGIHLEWEGARVYGAADISGYHLLVNGQQRGDMLPADTTSMIFRDCELGTFYQFRIVTLTGHICGSSGNGGTKRKSFSVHMFDNQKDTWTGLVDYRHCVPSEGVAIRYSGFVLAVNELSLQAVNTQCAAIWWKEPSSSEDVVPPVYFKLKCSNQLNESNSITHIQAALPNEEDYNHHFYNLTPNTSYIVTIETMLNIDSSTIGTFARSQQLHFTTLLPPTPPHNLDACPKLQSMIINWEPPTGQIEGYMVEIGEQDSVQGKRFTVKKDSTSCDVTHLKPGIWYEVSICAAYNEKMSDEVDDNLTGLSYTDTVTSYCAPLGPTPISDLLQVSIVNCHCLHFVWSPPNIATNEQLHSCTVLCKEGSTLFPGENDLSDWIMNINKNDNFVLRQQFPFSVTSCDIHNVSPNHCYSCAVMYSIVTHDGHQPTISFDGTSDNVLNTKHILSDVIITRVPSLAPTLLLSGVGTEIMLMWLPPRSDLPNTIIICGYLLKVNDIEFQFDSCTTKHTILNCMPGSEYSVSLQVRTTQCSDSKEWSVSQPDKLSIRFPDVDETGFHMLSCNYVTLESSDEDGPVKMIAISWDFKLLEEIVTVKSFIIEWQSSLGGEPGRVVQSSSCKGYDITDPLLRAIYTITVTALLSDGSNFKSTPLKYQIPSPPDSLLVSLEVIKSNYFIVKWTEPQQYGGLAIKGYQAILDDRRIGNILDVSCVSAKIPRRRQTAHTFTLQAVTTDENPDNYSFSNTLKIPAAAQATTSLSIKTPRIDIVHVEAKSTSIEISWKLHNINVSQHHQSVIIQWSSASSPKMRSEISAIGTHRNGSHTITCCKPGTVHFIKVVCTGRSNQTISKSNLVKVTTASPPEQPVIMASYTTSSITVQWKKPAEYGNDRIVHYKLQVNDNEHIVDDGATSFELHSCVSCRLYQFSLQAITAESCSKPSEVVTVRYPGIQFGAITQLSSGKLDCIACRWVMPEIHGHQVHHFNIYCRPVAEFSDKSMSFDINTITHGPLKPSTINHCFTGLKKTSWYLIMLEAVTDSSKVYQDTPHLMATALLPVVNITKCEVIEMKERAALEEKLCSSVMQRESMCLQLYWHASKKVSSRSPKRHADSIANLSRQLLDCEKRISKMLTLLEQHSTTAKVRICWQLSEQSSTAEVELSGYELLVDGKHWSKVPHTWTTSIIKLDCSKQFHSVAVKPLTSHCIGDGNVSQLVEVSTDQFTPFSLFCFCHIHSKNARWPDYDCCSYQNTFSQETTLDPMTHLPISVYYHHNQLVDYCSVINVFSGHVDNLLPTPPHNKPVVILFWTEWCTASADAMKLFIKLSTNHRHTYEFVTCCAGSKGGQESHLRQVKEMISRNVSLLNKELTSQVQHFCACSNSHQVHCGTKDHPEAIFNIIGVPTISIIHPNGHVVWQGRFFNKMLSQYNKEFLHTIHIALSQACPVDGCMLCHQAADGGYHTSKNAQMGGFNLGVYSNKLSY